MGIYTWSVVVWQRFLKLKALSGVKSDGDSPMDSHVQFDHGYTTFLGKQDSIFQEPGPYPLALIQWMDSYLQRSVQRSMLPLPAILLSRPPSSSSSFGPVSSPSTAVDTHLNDR